MHGQGKCMLDRRLLGDSGHPSTKSGIWDTLLRSPWYATGHAAEEEDGQMCGRIQSVRRIEEIHSNPAWSGSKSSLPPYRKVRWHSKHNRVCIHCSVKGCGWTVLPITERLRHWWRSMGGLGRQKIRRANGPLLSTWLLRVLPNQQSHNNFCRTPECLRTSLSIVHGSMLVPVTPCRWGLFMFSLAGYLAHSSCA